MKQQQDVLKQIHNQILQYDFLYQLQPTNGRSLPRLRRIAVHMALQPVLLDNKKKIIPLLLFLQLITFQSIALTKSTKNNLRLKIKQGSLIGGKITLARSAAYFFLENVFSNVLVRREYFEGFPLPKADDGFQFNLTNFLDFVELENEFLNFKNLPKLDINVTVNHDTDSRGVYLYLTQLSDAFFQHETE